MEGLFVFVILLILATILTAVVVGPVVAVIGLVRLRTLSHHVRKLERRVDELQFGRGDLMDVLPAETAIVEGKPRPRRLRERMADFTPPELETAHVESFIGRRVLAWAAAALLVLAAAFFLNYAVRSNLIGPAGQIGVVAAAGAALCAWGYRRHARGGFVTSQLLTGVGIFVLFLAIYAAFALYHLLSPSATSLFLTILMAQAAALAVLYRSPAVAVLSVVGGLLTPLLIEHRGDPYLAYFNYLLILNLAVQGVFVVRRWPGLRPLALLGTQGLFWLWFLDRYHPDKAGAVIAFQVILAAVYLGLDWLAARRRLSNVEDWALQIVTPWFLFLALRRVLGEFHPSWMGSLALVMALGWTLLTALASRPAFVRDAPRRLILLGTALAFLALSFPLQAKSYWATAGWALEGLALWWLGLRIRSQGVRGAGTVFLALAALGALYVMVVHAPVAPYWPVVNRRTLAVLAAAIGLLAAAWTARRFEARLEPQDTAVRYAAGLGGIVFVWLVLSFETWDGIELLIQGSTPMLRHTGLSFAWALYSGILLAIGFQLRHAPTRWTALGLFAVTTLKLMFFDLSELPGVYRVLTFLVGALVLAAAATAYRAVQVAKTEVVHER